MTLTELRSNWTEERSPVAGVVRFIRSDGAVVKYSMGPASQTWIAFEPDPSTDYLSRGNRRGLRWPRRWATANAAMAAVDREYPLRALEAQEEGR